MGEIPQPAAKREHALQESVLQCRESSCSVCLATLNLMVPMACPIICLENICHCRRQIRPRREVGSAESVQVAVPHSWPLQPYMALLPFAIVKEPSSPTVNIINQNMIMAVDPLTTACM